MDIVHVKWSNGTIALDPLRPAQVGCKMDVGVPEAFKVGDGLIKKGRIFHPNVLGWVEGRIVGGHVKDARGAIVADASPEGNVGFELAVKDGGHCIGRGSGQRC